MILGNPHALQEAALAKSPDMRRSVGLMLAEQADRVLFEDNKHDIQIKMGDLMEGLEDDWTRAGTALMLENMRQYIDAMDETTKLVNIGDFEKYAFNMVRALFPSLVAHEIASVQPMPGPVSLLFYQKFIYNATKGTAVAGQDIIENPNESYSSELIDSEQMDVGTGAVDTYTGNLSFTPVKPGTIQITTVVGATTQTVTDDGNGALVGDVGVGNNTIDYNTGAYDVTFTGNVDAAEPINATYTYDMEANDTLPAIDMTLTSSPVTAITRKLRTRWSVEAMQDLKNLHGMEAEVEQVAAITSELKYEIDREVVRNIKDLATNSVAAFSQTPSGISFTEHKLLFVDKIIQASNAIFDATQRAVGTWIVGGTNVASLVESLPGFDAAPKPANTRGVYKSGRLNGQWDFYKDPSYPGATRNATDNNAFMVGYKGISMWEVGYIFAPYIMAFTTPTVMLDDFIGRKGISSRYGKKSVDGRFFCTSSITGSPF